MEGQTTATDKGETRTPQGRTSPSAPEAASSSQQQPASTGGGGETTRSEPTGATRLHSEVPVPAAATDAEDPSTKRPRLVPTTPTRQAFEDKKRFHEPRSMASSSSTFDPAAAMP
eukprot:9562142-Heterocapsa_arctica.AAC.1